MAPSPSPSSEIVVSGAKLEKVFSMKGGKGDSSYANNSQAQAKHAESLIPLLMECLDKVQPNQDETFVIADLGCASGSNTINTVDVIVKHIAKRCKESGYVVPEFSAFFSDLPSNDFNTLFQLLPPVDETGLGRSYFAAGVPGSFYRRLFPARSIDVFYSAFSLHWLPQVPDVVLDKTSTAYNKGKIFIHGASKATAEAYKKQYLAGFAKFLKARSQEMKKGGTMFLACIGRLAVDPSDHGGAGILFGTHFQDVWNELVEEGLITGEQRDDFNIPLYAPSVEDFKEVVEAEGSFVINKLELFNAGSPLVVDTPDDPAAIGRALVKTCRSVSGVLVEAHIGQILSDELFKRVARMEPSRAMKLLEELQFNHVVASLSLA